MILARLIRVCASALLCAGVSLFPGNASADGAGTVVDGRAILKMSKGSNLCALTFDDGPSSHTERLMEILRERGIHATFFVVGKQVKYHPELIVRLQQEGHEIGNHTYSHQKGWGMSLERYTEDVDFANDLIHSELFRPPYARITPAQARFLGQRYKLVMWDIISRDYNRRLSPRTCLKNVCFPMELAGVKKAEAEKRAMELLEMVGLPDKANAYPAQLSGGQKQRIAIARALATNPKVLLCDEATSALDPNTTHSILTLIKDINQKLGITVVVITHQMSVVEEICDSVAILDGGVVVEQGSVQEIFANPKTAAAKRLVAPNGGSAARDLSCFAPDDHVVRVTFNGSSTAKPLVASLAAEKGILVSVLSADTRDLSGQCYGSMLLKLPAELAVAQQAVEYMRSQSGVTVEEVTGI